MIFLGQSPAVDGERPEPWGFWATIGWGLIIAAISVLAQLVVGILMVGGHEELLKDPKRLESNGLFLSLTVCASAPLTVGLCFFAAWLRRGVPVRDYLALRLVAGRALFRWCAGLLLLVILSDSLTSWLGRSIVPEFMVDAYQTAGFTPLLWLAFIVGAPLSEEVFFRGFLFAGLGRSRLGGGGAIVLTALLWSMIHLQYDAYGKVTIFVGGLLLGYARLKSGSLYPCILMHALMNFIATSQVMVLSRMTTV